MVLLALKTLELRARRDAFVIFFLGFFTMLTNFFFSQSLATAAAMLVALLGLLTALVNAHMPVGRPPLLQAARTAGWMALLGAPIMAVLFVLFPRFAPLWGIPGDAMSGRSGLSASMQVGNIASAGAGRKHRHARASSRAPSPPQSDLYFRGPVLSTFDGREWRPLRPRHARFPPPLPATAQLQVSGAPVRYEVTLEPQQPALAAGAGRGRASRRRCPGFETAMTSELQWLANRARSPTCCATAPRATPDFRHGPRSALAAVLPEYRELPPGFNPRTLALAAADAARPRLAAGGPRDAGAGRAGAAAHRRLPVHAGARRLRRAHGRRILVRPQGRLLRAHRLGLRGADARA